jgi:hypothetical protein
MTTTRKNLETRAALLSQLICNNAALYQASAPGEQGLLEVLIGNAIFFLPNTPELYSGKISEQALASLQSNLSGTKLVEEHGIPRKVAGRLLFTTYLEDLRKDPKALERLYLEQFGRYNLVLKKETDRLRKFQRASVFTSEESSYAQAGIVLQDFSLEAYQDYKRVFRMAQVAKKDALVNF